MRSHWMSSPLMKRLSMQALIRQYRKDSNTSIVIYQISVSILSTNHHLISFRWWICSTQEWKELAINKQSIMIWMGMLHTETMKSMRINWETCYWRSSVGTRRSDWFQEWGVGTELILQVFIVDNLHRYIKKLDWTKINIGRTTNIWI